MNKKKTSCRLSLERKVFSAVSPLVAKICEPPKMKNIKRALFIQPHPDDNQIAAGGTIAWLVERGVEVYELTVLDDRFIDLTYSGVGLTVRQKEALAAQECLGMKNAGFLGFGDRTKADVREISQALVRVIREIKPDAVFTADPNLENECHEDHKKVADAVKNAVLDATFPFYPEYIDNKPREDVWTVDTLGFYYTDKPNTIVDITDYEQKKIESMRYHKSQPIAALELIIILLGQQMAKGTDFKAAEVFRLISKNHMHCFTLPVG